MRALLVNRVSFQGLGPSRVWLHAGGLETDAGAGVSGAEGHGTVI